MPNNAPNPQPQYTQAQQVSVPTQQTVQITTPPNLSETEAQILMKFQQETKLNLKFAIQCLTEFNGNYDEALTAFYKLKVTYQIVIIL